MTANAEAQALAPPARYVCADHTNPVTWRGTGCPACAHDLAARARRRARRARDRRTEGVPRR